MRNLPVALPFFFLSFAVACADGKGPSEPSARVSSVAVTGIAPAIGQSAQFVATATFSDGTRKTISTNATWLSSNPLVASVSGSGVVTAIRSGTADISVTYQSVTGTIAIAIPAGSTDSLVRDSIESLFLGSGPLIPRNGESIGCPRLRTWSTFPFGTTVRLRVSNSLRADIIGALTTAAAQVSDASAGLLSVSMELTSEGNPLPSMNDVTVISSADAHSLGCPLAQGCTIFGFLGSNTYSARSILSTAQPAAAYVHDAIGHGVLGLCHIDGNLIGGAKLSLMSFGTGIFSNALPLQLTSLDLAATHPVFGSGIASGSGAFEFARLGLTNGPTTTVAPGPDAHSPAPSTSVIDAPRVR
jgi:hypothetical protein